MVARIAHTAQERLQHLQLHSHTQIRQHEPWAMPCDKEPSKELALKGMPDASAMRASLLRQRVTMQDQRESWVKMTGAPHGRLFSI